MLRQIYTSKVFFLWFLTATAIIGGKIHKTFLIFDKTHRLHFSHSIIWGDLAFILFSFALVVCGSLLLRKWSKKWAFLFAFLINLALLFVTAIEHIFFLITGSPGTWDLFLYSLGNMRDLLPLLLKVDDVRNLLLLLLLTICGLFVWLARSQKQKNTKETTPNKNVPLQTRTLVFVSFVCFLITGSILVQFPSAFDFQRITNQNQNMYRPPRTLETNVIFFLASGFVHAMTKTTSVLPPSLREKAPFNTTSLRFVKGPSFRPWNVVFIILESARARSTTTYNQQHPTMNYLSELSSGGLVVEKLFATIPHTSKSLVSSLCGIYPNITIHITESKKNGLPARCIPALLQEHGYKTAFFQTSSFGFENRKGLLQNMSFEHKVARETLSHSKFEKIGYFGYEDKALTKPTLQWIDKQRSQKKPFFATILTITSHHDYALPKRFQKRKYTLNKTEIPHKSRQSYQDYLNTLKYTDEYIKELFTGFKKRGMLKDTIFFIYGDHGEGFNEHKRLQHDNVIWDEGLHVPGIVVFPRKSKTQLRIKGNREHVDILPTLAEFMGFNITGGKIPGRSWLQKPQPNRILFHSCWYLSSCMAIRIGNQKIIDNYGYRAPELFDLKTDPKEQNNLFFNKNSTIKINTARDHMRMWKQRINMTYELLRYKKKY